MIRADTLSWPNEQDTEEYLKFAVLLAPLVTLYICELERQERRQTGKQQRGRTRGRGCEEECIPSALEGE